MAGRAAVTGPPGTVRDLVTGILNGAGLDVEVVAEIRTSHEAGSEQGKWLSGTDVLVVVCPTPAQWTAVSAFAGRVVLVSEDRPDSAEVVHAVLTGADAVIHLDNSPDSLVDAVFAVRAGGTLLDDGQTRLLADTARAAGGFPLINRPLTPRERSILRSAERGETVKQTARELGISPKTVENLQSRLFQKLGARNRAHAVVLAHRLGLRADPEHSAS